MDLMKFATMIFTLGIFSFLAFQVGPLLSLISKQLAEILAELRPDSPTNLNPLDPGCPNLGSVAKELPRISEQTDRDEKTHNAGEIG